MHRFLASPVIYGSYFTVRGRSQSFRISGLIPKFLSMIRNSADDGSLHRRSVYALAIFEVDAAVTQLPETKAQLSQLLAEQLAVPFHYKICSGCHKQPGAKEWLAEAKREKEEGEGKIEFDRFYVS